MLISYCEAVILLISDNIYFKEKGGCFALLFLFKISYTVLYLSCIPGFYFIIFDVVSPKLN